MGKKVVVVGAGIVGLTSAWTLLENGYDVSVVGKNIPGDISIEYTSPFAGANWSSFAKRDDVFTQNLDKKGYVKFLQFAATEPNSGILRVEAHRFFRKNEVDSEGNPLKEKNWYLDGFVENVRKLSKDELPKGEDIVAGYSFDTVTVTTTIYLHYVLQKVFSLGGTLARRNLKHINEAYSLHHSGEKADLVVNSTGLLSRFLGGVEDTAVHPIRGQIVRIRNDFKHQVSLSTPGYEGESFYAFPRKEGGGIVGGSFLSDNWSGVVDPKLSERIIERIHKYIPGLETAEIDVIEDYVGLRPARRGGPRIEREGSIIHNYGIGGGGYQGSFGLADEVLRLANEFSRQSKI